jgi:nitrogen fixation protein NifB
MNRLNHPCFEADFKHKYGRAHLPVAPGCNVQCNYCNRKFDCVNESRPGVSSVILSPAQAVDYLGVLIKLHSNIAVAGIAGPGDPFANAQETMETIRLVRKNFPEMILCLSTNGLEISKYIAELYENEVSHITITINALDPIILAEIFSWVRFNKKVYRGVQAGALIIDRQLEAVELLKKKGFTVKINSIILPGINDKHIPMVAEETAKLGADTFNCIPVYRNKDTVFEDIEVPTAEIIKNIQDEVSKYIKPMKHCARCRADSAGMLGQDIPERIDMLNLAARKPLFATENRPFVAVASEEGIFVNQHLGEAEELNIYGLIDNEYRHVEKRATPKPGSGDWRWIDLSKKISDCSVVLVNGAGQNPTNILKSLGVKVIQMEGLIEEGLDWVYKGQPLKASCNYSKIKCGESCSGTGDGCG